MEGSTRLEEAICEEGEFRQQFCHPPAPFQNTSGKSSKTVQQTWGVQGCSRGSSRDYCHKERLGRQPAISSLKHLPGSMHLFSVSDVKRKGRVCHSQVLG